MVRGRGKFCCLADASSVSSIDVLRVYPLPVIDLKRSTDSLGRIFTVTYKMFFPRFVSIYLTFVIGFYGLFLFHHFYILLYIILLASFFPFSQRSIIFNKQWCYSLIFTLLYALLCSFCVCALLLFFFFNKGYFSHLCCLHILFLFFYIFL